MCTNIRRTVCRNLRVDEDWTCTSSQIRGVRTTLSLTSTGKQQCHKVQYNRLNIGPLTNRQTTVGSGARPSRTDYVKRVKHVFRKTFSENPSFSGIKQIYLLVFGNYCKYMATYLNVAINVNINLLYISNLETNFSLKFLLRKIINSLLSSSKI